jgi:protein-tyrosine kinase
MLQEHCRQLCLSLFYREQAPIRSLGFTSSIAGEGKSFVAAVTAQGLARDSREPVTLVECNWDHPSQHEYFGIPATPGLAEWLWGTCEEEAIRYQVESNLTVIPAGHGAHNAVKLLQQIQQQGLLHLFAHAEGFYIIDLPPIITSGYGSLAASLPESLVLVVRAQVIPESMVVETCTQLKDVPIHGIILNQGDSRIPRWLRQLL